MPAPVTRRKKHRVAVSVRFSRPVSEAEAVKALNRYLDGDDIHTDANATYVESAKAVRS